MVTQQSSNRWPDRGLAHLATDGDYDGDYVSASHTDWHERLHTWLSVDLGHRMKIARVKIYNPHGNAPTTSQRQ